MGSAHHSSHSTHPLSLHSVSNQFIHRFAENMKNSVARAPRDVISHVSPKSRKIRKASAERKEKEKVENKLRKLVGSDDDSSQLDLILATIAHIRELQAQLNGKENNLPEGFEKYFSSCSTSPCSSVASSRPESPL